MTKFFYDMVTVAGALIFGVALLAILYLIVRLIGRAFAVSWFEVQERSEEESFDKLFEEGEDNGEKQESEEVGGRQHEGSRP